MSTRFKHSLATLPYEVLGKNYMYQKKYKMYKKKYKIIIKLQKGGRLQKQDLVYVYFQGLRQFYSFTQAQKFFMLYFCKHKICIKILALFFMLLKVTAKLFFFSRKIGTPQMIRENKNNCYLSQKKVTKLQPLCSSGLQVQSARYQCLRYGQHLNFCYHFQLLYPILQGVVEYPCLKSSIS